MGELGARVEGEIRAAAALTLVVVHAAYRGPAPWAFVSDASGPGFALHECQVLLEEALAAYRWKERWRFQGVLWPHAEVPSPLPAGVAADDDLLAPMFKNWAMSEGDFDKGEKMRRPPGLSSRAAALLRKPDYDENEDLVPPLNPKLLDAARWKRVVVGAWKGPDAIHIKEGRASLLGLQRGCRRAECRGRVILSVGDNMSEILGSEKGVLATAS